MLTAFFVAAALLLIVAWHAGRSMRDTNHFFVASRSLPGALVALGQASHALPMWLLAAVAGAAFTWGFAAVWILFTALVGYGVGWFFVAPRLRAWSVEQQRITLPLLLTGDTGRRMRVKIVLSVSLMLFAAVLIGLAAYLPLLGQVVAQVLPVSARTGMVLGVALATLCALLGGAKGVARTDAIRAVVVVVLVILVAVMALVAAGGWQPVWAQLSDLPVDVGLWTGEQAAILAITFALGTLMLGILPYGQPVVVAPILASAHPEQLVVARRTALLWSLLMLVALLACGWAARLLLPAGTLPEAVLPALVREVLPAPLAAAALVLLLVFAFAALDSVLLTLAAAVSVDLHEDRRPRSLNWPQPAIVLVGALALAVAIIAPAPGFERLLLSWSLLGAAFGPLLVVRLTGKRVRPGSTLGSLWAGFLLTLLLHQLPSAPGDFLERALPFVAALGIALTGGERRADPDRADRSAQRPPPGIAS